MKNKLAITVDVEDWYHLPPFTGAPNSKFKDVPSFFKIWKYRYDYLTKPTFRILDLLQQYRITGTFFIVADVAYYYSGLVEEIARRGHEIACHGLHHACKIDPKTKKPLIPPDEFKQRTILAKSILEQASGKKVIGYRAPNAYIAGWMIDILEEIGFRYDSSVCVNSIYNKADCSLKGISSKPYYPKSGGLEPGNSKRGILEIPWPYFSVLLKFPTAGGPALRMLGARYIKKGLKESLMRGDTIFYFHPIDISEESFPLNSLTNKIFWMIKGNRVFAEIKEILSDSEFAKTTCSELLEKAL
ncbi:TPA: DUF3473 domain-containing protein [Candidatus Poribacteria bacterium]|nr:DUF3473 domain-containing protein [Candidatus Poribacteria bacterium]